MTFEMLQTLVDYHYWARDRLFPVVETLTEEQLRRPLGNSFSSVFDTVVHLVRRRLDLALAVGRRVADGAACTGAVRRSGRSSARRGRTKNGAFARS